MQQLCDAGEEEFLEIMALVGMASKPLHVRRLQKALQEWLTNPCKVSWYCSKNWWLINAFDLFFIRKLRDFNVLYQNRV